MLVSPEGLYPYVELGMQRENQYTFNSFRNMWYRLQQKTSVGRYVGIEVDPSWISFRKFLLDMGSRPKGLTLDRVDSSGGYSPNNCRWASVQKQAENRKSVIKVTDGVSEYCLKGLCSKLEIPYKSVYARLYNGWILDEAISTPIITGSNIAPVRISSGRFSFVDPETYSDRF